MSRNSVIQVHPLTNNPTAAWAEISKNQTFTQLKIKNPSTPVKSDEVRIVCMSDTHSATGIIKFKIPDGDIFVHAGDFTRCGMEVEIIQFNQWIATLPHRHKIVIAGNHELNLDKNCNTFSFVQNQDVDPEKLLYNCIYLQDSDVTLFGLKFYGSPWQPKYKDWAFNLQRGEEILSKWNMIPDDTDILITHGPPLGHGDVIHSGTHEGCLELLSTVQQRVKPKYHIFGHIHEGYGITSDGTTVFVNAATCNRYYLPKNLPIVFDVPLPKGHSKI